LAARDILPLLQLGQPLGVVVSFSARGFCVLVTNQIWQDSCQMQTGMQ